MDADGQPDLGGRLEATFNPFVTMLRDLPIPYVTAVNGAAAGIGCSFALLGDLIVAGESAYFLQAFRRIGLVPDGSATYHLPRMIGRVRAMEMMLLGEKIPAKTALEWGLINRCVPDAELLPTAKALALELANGPTKTLGMIRRLAWASLDNTWDEQIQAERQRPTRRRPHRRFPRRRAGVLPETPSEIQRQLAFRLLRLRFRFDDRRLGFDAFFAFGFFALAFALAIASALRPQTAASSGSSSALSGKRQ